MVTGCDVIYLLISERTDPNTELTEPNTELVADHSGNVFLIRQPIKKPIWSFSTGSPIHSSYQAPLSAENNTENATELSSRALVVEYMDNSKPTTVDDRYTIWVWKTKRL